MHILTDPETIAAAGPRALTPDVPLETIREIARSPRFQRFRDAAAQMARRCHAGLFRQQAAIGRDNQQTEWKAVDGLGVLHMRITQEEYLKMRARYGDNCWDDPDFVEAYRRDNEYCRVQTTRGTRGQSYVSPSPDRRFPNPVQSSY